VLCSSFVLLIIVCGGLTVYLSETCPDGKLGNVRCKARTTDKLHPYI
jgi:hypothetical protein